MDTPAYKWAIREIEGLDSKESLASWEIVRLASIHRFKENIEKGQ
ncbi:hypothetical protein LCGC14_1477160 [marine sediment metagenome]|uniref:Uncharacterized protein n=1 Tax=marine sediment metagenome TaxID=412755 RepID=A0A0F9JBE0_9ZZZZ